MQMPLHPGMSRPVIFAVSGVKNSGKTTFISSLVRILAEQGLRTAVIKHDGHEFEPDVPGTDSYKVRKSGAQDVAVFSGGRLQIVREDLPGMTDRDAFAEELIGQFPEADVIILEGFKNSAFKKFEIVRKDNSDAPVCDPQTLLGLVTDLDPAALPEAYREIPVFGLDAAGDVICMMMK